MQHEDTEMLEPPPVPGQAEVDDDLDDLEDLEDDLHWVLGFPEPALHPSDLLRHVFPSKVGGRPAWLDPVRLPSAEELRCPVDGSTMRFLLQVYAPVEERPEAFHRTIFVFVSGRKGSNPSNSGGCVGDVCVRALRCQMARENEYYVYHPLSDAERLAGPKQVPSVPADPWAVAAHEQAVVEGRQDMHIPASSLPGLPSLFPEYEIVIEEEPDTEGIDNKDDPNAAAAIQQQHQQQQQQQQQQQEQEQHQAKLAELSNATNNYTEEELPSDLIDELEKNMPKDKRHFASFATRISNAPSQILRYCFEDGSAPICPNPEGMPRPEDVPPCESCGTARRFEFQIMPQLLNILGVDPSDDTAVDFGTIAVYSCGASCGTTGGYKHEFVWVGKS